MSLIKKKILIYFKKYQDVYEFSSKSKKDIQNLNFNKNKLSDVRIADNLNIKIKTKKLINDIKVQWNYVGYILKVGD